MLLMLIHAHSNYLNLLFIGHLLFWVPYIFLLLFEHLESSCRVKVYQILTSNKTHLPMHLWKGENLLFNAWLVYIIKPWIIICFDAFPLGHLCEYFQLKWVVQSGSILFSSVFAASLTFYVFVLGYVPCSLSIMALIAMVLFAFKI